MAQAVVLPLIERKDFLPNEIFAVVGRKESVPSVAEKFPKGMRIVSSDDPIAEDVWNAAIQLLAIKPQQLPLFEGKNFNFDNPNPSSRPLLISVLAGVTLKRLQKIFPGHVCVRSVPNIPVLVGAGLTGLAWAEGVTEKQRSSVMKIFNPISEVFELPEVQLDAFLALTSSGPAYVSLMIEALADGAVAAGLPRHLAYRLTHKMLSGTALFLNEKAMHPSELKDMVASPGGTTITALRHLEMAGVRSALMEAVVVAAERSRSLNGGE